MRREEGRINSGRRDGYWFREGTDKWPEEGMITEKEAERQITGGRWDG